MWRLYVRWPKQKRFQPVNWRKGLQVGNLIYATVFSEEERQQVEAELEYCARHNVGMEWEFRAV